MSGRLGGRDACARPDHPVSGCDAAHIGCVRRTVAAAAECASGGRSDAGCAARGAAVAAVTPPALPRAGTGAAIGGLERRWRGAAALPADPGTGLAAQPRADRARCAALRARRAARRDPGRFLFPLWRGCGRARGGVRHSRQPQGARRRHPSLGQDRARCGAARGGAGSGHPCGKRIAEGGYGRDGHDGGQDRGPLHRRRSGPVCAGGPGQRRASQQGCRRRWWSRWVR